MSKRKMTWMLCLGALLLMPIGCQQSEPAVDESEEVGESLRVTMGEPIDAPSAESAEEATGQPAQETADESPEEAASEPAEEAASDTGGQTAGGGTPVQVEVPLGLPPLEVPEDNPMTAEKIELGKLLYFDTRLSKNGTISCATCHDPQMAWTEHDPTSTGIDEQVGGRNSPTVINAAYAPAQFWDGRAESLEEQALGPIENPIEMGHSLPDMISQLEQLSDYTERFQNVFGTGVTAEGVAKAIAAFERTVLSGNSPYDKFTEEGDQAALSDAQKRGMKVFEDAGCSTCHTPPLFSNYRYYNAGVDADTENPDPGRKEVTGEDRDFGKFRVPSLREVANTGPYFHDGSVATLEEAVAFMAGGGQDNPNLSPILKALRETELSEQDQQDLVEFLKALSGEYPVVEPPRLPGK